MSAFDLDVAAEKARRRLGRGPRRARADRHTTRFLPAVEQRIAELLAGQERPSFAAVHGTLASFCESHGLPVPARSSLYNAVDRVPVPTLPWAGLPAPVRRSLYNLDAPADGATIAGDQLAFYAFNHGEPRALSFAAGLPWLCLVRADGRRGWRPKSHALLRSVMRFRGLR